jgi:putative hydrolase of the HAD superfamily
VVTGLLLDIDDTLIDTRAAMVAAGEAAVAELWPQAGAALHRAAGVHFRSDPSGLFGRFTTGEISFAQMRRARVADLIDSFSPVALGEVQIEEANRRFEEAYEPAFVANVRLFDDVLPLMEAAGKAGIRIGLLTNSSSHYTRQKLGITALSGVFDVVVTTDTLGFGKPDPRAFQHACRLMGLSPAETVYVGDDLEIDAMAASHAGLGAIWLRRDPGDSEGADRARACGIPVVTSLSEVPAILGRSGRAATR